MHPRNIFKDSRPDFSTYATTRPTLKPHLKHTPLNPQGFQYTLDFSDPQALRELTCACLEHEFGLKVDLPPNHLVPSIPQRLNYIHWIEDILSLDRDSHPIGDEVVGVDIGCGPLCIYPLLGTHLNQWKFLATEIQSESIQSAKENIARNNFDNKITVLEVKPEVILKGAVDTPPHDHTQYAFCMCNPPFYCDQVDLMGGASRSGHRPIPDTQNTGNESETVTEGGEVNFVRRLISDSLTLGLRIRWYTSMVGKKSSLVKIKSFLREENVDVVMDTTFVQGKTHRWGVAWSHDPTLKKIAHGKALSRRSRPYTIPVTEFSKEEKGFDKAVNWLKESLSKLKIEYTEVINERYRLSLNCKTIINTWSKQRKRKRLMKRIEETKDIELGTELESLNTACSIEFLCIVEELDYDERETIKKPISDSVADKRSELVYILDWISGDCSRDELYQIVQLIQNWLP